MSTTDILVALVERLATYVADPAIPVAWPGVPKKPPGLGMWIEARYFPNEPEDLTWDEEPHQDTRGFFQVALYWRPGELSGQHNQIQASIIADSIIDHFPKGLPISNVEVRKKAWQSPAVDLEGKSFIPITVPYRGIVSTVAGIGARNVADGLNNVVNGVNNVTNG